MSRSGKSRLAKADLTRRLDQATYEKKLLRLQRDMRRLQVAYMRDGRRGIVVFEGWDAAGKGGTIRRMSAELDPRGYKVWPIAEPGDDEQSRHYLFRFWQRLPARGTIAIFDRSWYGRVLVERVEGLTPKHAWKRAYREIRDFEHTLADDGVKIVKLFMHISAEEQLHRFEKRLKNPYKRWKLTVEDIRNRSLRADYLAATEEMLRETSTRENPWHVIPSENKRYGRVRAMELVLRELGRHVDMTPPQIDPAVVVAAEESLGIKVDGGGLIRRD
ncbi:MAG: polyphosphate kinase [Rhodovibrionaceae bacterium]|nr:polyphosphate kinase [Rhodovibrionaceae bacterium]